MLARVKGHVTYSEVNNGAINEQVALFVLKIFVQPR
jgi:hypothetical protein